MESVTSQPRNLTHDQAKRLERANLIKLSSSNVNAKIEVKKGNHKEGRMKVTLKFSKDEAEGFNNFCKLAKPENITQDNFVKFLFYKGVEALQKDLVKSLEEYREKHPEEYEKIKAELDTIQAEQPTGSVTVADETPKL